MSIFTQNENSQLQFKIFGSQTKNWNKNWWIANNHEHYFFQEIRGKYVIS
jgi:hypothetical protein